jgi:Protein of unknown function (DUF3054)
MSDELALCPVREDDLPMLEELTQDPEKTGEFGWPGYADRMRRPGLTVSDPPSSRTRPAARVRPAAAGILDACCVLAFVAIGRASHHDGDSLAGLASTAWPFLAGLAAGWLVTRAWRRPAAIVPAGLGAWLGTVVIGMLLRVVAGQGTAPAFIGVALAFLGLFLLGWRAVAAALPRSGRGPSPAPRP